MPTNVEIKARVDDLDAMRRRAAALSDDGPHELVQDDTFFRCADGRLKLRVFPDGQGELIFYRRADTHGPRVCDYRIARIPDPEALRASLAAAWGKPAACTSAAHCTGRAARASISTGSRGSATSSNSKWCSPTASRWSAAARRRIG